MNTKNKFLEAGEIVSTHGIHGTVRVKPWSDSPQFLCEFERLYIDEKEYEVVSSTVHKTLVLCTLNGIDSVDAAIPLKGKTVYINREDARLEKNRYFIADIIGLEVVDKNLGLLGRLTDVLTLPANNVYVVEGGKRYMIPAVDAFVKRTSLEDGLIEVEIIEGMDDEN
jgi:16S rRNA processing protein RimM